MLLTVLAPPLPAQQLPLPAAEQAAVDDAIERGVKFLKATQFKNGTWAEPKSKHPFGYSALPGLTLLECDVSPSDPLIQRTAHFLRSKSSKIDSTYELSLAILFLDRLGDSQDKPLVQKYALRLIAGQSATGGWGYKCPVLGPRTQLELMTALRQVDPPRPGGMPFVDGGAPGKMPGIARGPGAKPAELGPTTQSPGSPSIGDTTAIRPNPSLSGTTTGGSGSSLHPQGTISREPSLWREWLGLSATDGSDSKLDSTLDLSDPKEDKKDPKKKADGPPPDRAANDKPKDAKAGDDKPADANAPPNPEKAFVVPVRLRRLPVFQDPAQLAMLDPLGRPREVFLTTTDNSNTQFAILALWTAQRYDVPMNRSLNLIVRRFATSQRPDGAWSYRHRFGGGLRASAPMTCVGLIGLAVGHGLQNQGPGVKAVVDQRILNGLAALSQAVGKPTGQWMNLPMQNLYFLWSLERVAVLYNLSKIGDKDWYRWGAEVLVANQGFRGNWDRGGYPAAHPIIDTCLALLFLKRANLVKDLTSRLPFNPGDLNGGVMEKLFGSPPPTEKKTEPNKKSTTPKSETPPPTTPAPMGEIGSQPVGSPDSTTATARASAPSQTATVAESGNGNKKWIVLSIVLFLLLAGGSVCFIWIAVRRKKDNEEDKNRKLKGPKSKRKSTASNK